MDNCSVSTYEYSVVLPTGDALLEPVDTGISFKIIFTCNGQTLTSDVLSDMTSALAWVQSIWSEFGTWSSNTNILRLKDSLCSNGSLTYQVAESPFIYGCNNPLAINYNDKVNVPTDTCIFPPPEPGTPTVVFDINGKYLRETSFGANIKVDDVAELASITSQVITIGFQEYLWFNFNNLAGLMDNSAAATINTFLDAHPNNPGIIIYYPIQYQEVATAFPQYVNWYNSKFPGRIICVQLDAETLNITKGSGKGMTNQTYVNRSWIVMNYDPSKQYAWDLGLMDRYPNTYHVERNKEIAKQPTPPIGGRQYIHTGDILAYTTDQQYNLTLFNNYINVTLPNYRSMFKTYLPNLTYQDIFQFHPEDLQYDFVTSKPLGHFIVCEVVRSILENTGSYRRLLWMSLGNLIHQGTPKPMFHSMKLVAPLFTKQYIIPVTLPYNGVTGLGFWDGADDYSLLLNSQNPSQQIITASDIGIAGKTISGNFTRNTRWAANLNAAIQQDTNVSESDIIVHPYSGSVVNFTAV